MGCRPGHSTRVPYRSPLTTAELTTGVAVLDIGISATDLAAWSSALDRIDPPQIDVFGKLGYVPTPKQRLFHDAPEWDVLLGGSAGGGKTRALTMEAIRSCVMHPGLRVGAFRRTYGELKESLLAELAQAGFAGVLGAKWNGSEYTLSFPNGAMIMFRYAESMLDASRRLGGQYQLLIFDERTQTAPDVIAFLESRLRSGRKDLPVLGVRSACVDEGEVLTETGWKPIQMVRVGDLVQSIDLNGYMSLKPVDWTFSGPATSSLVRVRKRSLYMSMTTDHRIVWKQNTSLQYRVDPWDSLPHKSLNIARTSNGYDADGDIDVPFGWATDDYLAFLGLFLAEGCTNATVRKHTHKTVITQCTPDNQGVIKELLDRLTLPRSGTIRCLPSGNYNVRWYDEGARCNRTFPTEQEARTFLASVRVPLNWNLSLNGDFQMSRRVLWEYFRQFGKAHEKFVPRNILEHATRPQLRVIFDWMMFGDGSVRGKGSRYFTSSQQLADDVAEIGIKLGIKVQTRKHVLPNPAHRDRYIIYLNSEKQTTALYRDPGGLDETSVERFTGQVHCIKVRDNGTFVVRQRGCVWVSGNTNPGGPGHSAVKERYIKATNYGDKVILDQRGRTVRFIPSKLAENPHVNPEYATDLKALPEHLRRAYLEGDWDVFAGQVFTEWSHDRHVVRPMTLPEGWQRYNGVDWGYTAPWAVIWAAVDEDARVWIYREIYQPQVGEAEQARRILAAETETERVAVRYADDAMWATRGDAKPIADVYAENGVHLKPAGKGAGSRVNGWQRVHSYLADGPACPHHRSLGWETCPKLHVFSTCEKFISTVPDLPHAQTGDPEDADTRADDHIADALRYLLVNLGTEPRFHFPQEESAKEGPLDPQAQPVNPRPPPPLPQTFGGFPVLQGGSPWG